MRKRFFVEEVKKIVLRECADDTASSDNLGATNSELISSGTGGHRLQITEEAFRGISAHVGYGEATPDNNVEQGGLLVGDVYRCMPSGRILGRVDQAIPALSAEGSMTHLSLTHDAWFEMMLKLDQVHSQLAEGCNFWIIGWYHTHPQHLPVFMSGTDLASQARLFREDWHFAVVLNPHKKLWRAFRGSKAEECDLCIDRG